MAKAKWGTKRLCPSCGVRFYDMKRSPVSCPSCNSEVSVEPLLKPRKPAPAKETAAPAKVEEKVEEKTEAAAPDETGGETGDDVADIEDAEDIEDDDEDDDALIEQADDLEEEDDVSEIKEHMEEASDKDT